MALRRKSRKSQRKSNKTARKRHIHRGGARCRTCGGSGGLTYTLPCNACDGKGGRTTDVTDSDGNLVKKYEQCAICKGKGETENRFDCMTCNGTGTVPDPKPILNEKTGQYYYPRGSLD